MTRLVSRAVYPVSGLKATRWVNENSSICEANKYPIEAMTKDKFYQNALTLYNLKDGLKRHLSTLINELFDFPDKTIYMT